MDQQPANPFGSIIGSLSWDCQYQARREVAGHLHITIYTAEPGTEDAERLALLIVLGTQTLVG
jgi:hypothetical protein